MGFFPLQSRSAPNARHPAAAPSVPAAKNDRRHNVQDSVFIDEVVYIHRGGEKGSKGVIASRLPLRRRLIIPSLDPKRNVEPVPAVDADHGERQVREIGFGELLARLAIRLV